jgi:hypothetical protein
MTVHGRLYGRFRFCKRDSSCDFAALFWPQLLRRGALLLCLLPTTRLALDIWPAALFHNRPIGPVDELTRLMITPLIKRAALTQVLPGHSGICPHAHTQAVYFHL